MSSSFKEAVEELAELAGVSPEILLKVAGVLSMVALLAPARKHAIKDGDARIVEAISAEPVIPLSDLQNTVGFSSEELRQAVDQLVKKGVIHTADDPVWGTLVAVDSDGTLKLSELDDRDRRRVIINWYANRHKNLSYKAVHDINRQILEQKVRGLRIKDKVLEALRNGVKSRAQLVALGINEDSLDKALRKLVNEGAIKRVGKGLYQIKG